MPYDYTILVFEKIDKKPAFAAYLLDLSGFSFFGLFFPVFLAKNVKNTGFSNTNNLRRGDLGGRGWQDADCTCHCESIRRAGGDEGVQKRQETRDRRQESV